MRHGWSVHLLAPVASTLNLQTIQIQETHQFTLQQKQLLGAKNAAASYLQCLRRIVSFRKLAFPLRLTITKRLSAFYKGLSKASYHPESKPIHHIPILQIQMLRKLSILTPFMKHIRKINVSAYTSLYESGAYKIRCFSKMLILTA
jgi:hypothetical protein